MKRKLDISPLRPDERASCAPEGTQRVESWTVVAPVPDGVVVTIPWHRLGSPNFTWEYRSAAGQLLFAVCRFDVPGDRNEKEIVPLCYCQNSNGIGEWRWKGPNAPRPLYRLDKLSARPTADVLVCEGEKACDAAQKLFPDYIAVTSQGGAKAAGKTDWSPLKDRRVIIWPDNDAAGAAYAKSVVSLLQRVESDGAGIVAVPSNFPASWDLADNLPPEIDIDGIHALVRSAAAVASEHCESASKNISTLPKDHVTALGFYWDSEGLYYQDPGENGTPMRIAGPLEVIAATRDMNGSSWGLHLRWKDPDDYVHNWVMPKTLLAGDGQELKAKLLDGGLFLDPRFKSRQLLSMFLSSVRPTSRAVCVDRGGWHADAYMMADGTPYGCGDDQPLVLQGEPTATPLDRRGTLEGWQTNVAALAVDNSRLVLALCMAFTGPVLSLVGEASFGFNFVGSSSIGKTIALRVAASVSGARLGTWRATDNAIEALAAASNDGLLILDELSQVDGHVVEAIVYMVGNGHGESRMTRGADFKKPKVWTLAFLSTGEIGLDEKLRSVGRQSRAGQGVRMIDIPADANAGHGIFERLHGHADGRKMASHLEAATTSHCGHALRLFVEQVVEQKATVAAELSDRMAQWVSDHVPTRVDGQVDRVAKRFALAAAAGEMAAEMGILPWAAGDASRSVGTCFSDYLRLRGGTGPAEIEFGIGQVREFLSLHGTSRFEELDDNSSVMDQRGVSNRAGFRRRDDAGCWEYLVMVGPWRNEVCKGINPQTITKTLIDHGFLIPDREGKSSQVIKLRGYPKMRMYVVKAAILGAEPQPPSTHVATESLDQADVAGTEDEIDASGNSDSWTAENETALISDQRTTTQYEREWLDAAVIGTPATPTVEAGVFANSP
jgi:uncharacterized protein (DUF927 family)